MDQQPDLNQTLEQLELLAPHSAEKHPTPHAALLRFKNSQPAPRRSFVMKNWKPVAVGLFAVLALIFIFSFAPTRALADDFLGLFRVEKFAPISIAPEQLAVLEEIADSGLFPGELIMVTEPGPERVYTNFNEAFESLETPYYSWFTPEFGLGMPQEFVVQPGGSAQLTVNLDSARAILEAVDVDPLLLPDSLDGAVVSAELYDALFLDYGAVQLLQTPVPDVNYPDDVDPTVIGEAALRFLGMDDDEAYRLAHNIDWTNTLVMPVPTELASFSEVKVGDTTGIAVEALDSDGSMIMWQSYGMVYMLTGTGDYTSDALLTIANTIMN
ncbi:MAG: hypothetical protein M9930_11155 [Anaerolineae bacterium]|nr:hypothetical protein [Anaerolineae bacterium]